MENIKLSEDERVVLGNLYQMNSEDGDMDLYWGFDQIGHDIKFDRKKTRRVVRSLARKGLADFMKGLMNEDGEVAGAGYAISEKGKELYEKENDINQSPN